MLSKKQKGINWEGSSRRERDIKSGSSAWEASCIGVQGACSASDKVALITSFRAMKDDDLDGYDNE
ncbi:hypothetical protein [Cyclobacterium jeungdonense]|uniref:Uncharacterized protein n=1 Tax=Cyclobacterium jeungdonense TaxID=708087 RepID=A0ABT8CC41_9BACT|nr:hypothetical protein [Cyclobacterium jeungdonense]MDN3689519.1 hypothetical protein [Cyclobacterium jeungdonense]